MLPLGKQLILFDGGMGSELERRGLEGIPEELNITHAGEIRAIHRAYAEAGADIITFHLESESDTKETIAAIRAGGAMASLSIKPATPVQAVFPYLDTLSMVLIMSVEPGFGGQSFQESCLEKIRILRREAQKRDLPLLIQVDGGIDENTIALCAAAGADTFAVGSTIFRADDRKAAIQHLRIAAQG